MGQDSTTTRGEFNLDCADGVAQIAPAEREHWTTLGVVHEIAHDRAPRHRNRRIDYVGPDAASPVGRSTTPRVDHAEEITLRVSEDHEIFTGLAGPVDGGAEVKQSFDFSFWFVRVEVKMQSAPVGLHLVDGYVGPFSCRVLQDNERVSGGGRPPRSVTKRLLPEDHHSSEVVAVNHDGPDAHGTILHDAHDSTIRR